ncbi:hypothetical protein [Haloparvum sp. PAK95]|uniref:hypothetical protein n=1 Tax=Haloparvum sp. PAK95 TaxID=3418962 RepID=UPI003D2F4328
MLRVEREVNLVRATDAAKQTSVVDGRFAPASDGPDLPRGVDETVFARATSLEFPPGFAVVEDLDADESTELGRDVGPIELESGAYCIRLNAPVMTYLRFDGAATIRKPQHREVVVEFPARTPVTLGFRSRIKSPREEIRVPETVDGFATALSAISGSHRTQTPDRSFPTMRQHPPELTFTDPVDGETRIPPGLRGSRDDVELVLPPDLRYLVTGASLGHYLGATVRTEPGATPTLVAGDRHELPPLPEFPHAASELLQRTFYLDCLVRNVGPHGTELAESEALDRLAVDPHRVYDQSVPERVETYLELPYDRVADVFPEWHLSLYVQPTFERARALPYVLFNVPQLFLPESESLDSDEWLSRSLGDFYRSRRESASVDLRRPELGPGRNHGWLADGVPIDVFKSRLSAYENRARYRQQASDGLSIVAVVNDADMGIEASEAAETYRDRAAALEVDASVSVREELSTDDLASVFEAGHDMVHFVGHCEPDGLVCTDGHLATSDLAESNAETFFLNACGSYYEGLDLIENGSVAGGVTFNRVLEDNAAKVGTAFARLLAQGFSIERAMDLSRRRVMAGKDYAVVGDGSHTLLQAEEIITAHLRVEEQDGTYHVVHHPNMPDNQGSVYQSHLQEDDRSHLYGSKQEFRVDRERLKEFLGYGVTPVIYNGDLGWSDELREEL